MKKITDMKGRNNPIKSLMALLSVILFLNGIAVNAVSEIIVEETTDNIHWTLSDDGELVIMGSGKMPYQSSSSGWRIYKDTIKSVIVDEGITSICTGAFSECDELQSVRLPNSLTTIDTDAFSRSKSLKKCDIPSNVSFIGGGAFQDCTSLKSIILPEGLKTVDGWLFYGCSNLSKVVIPASVDRIFFRAFESTAISDCIIPDEVTLIDVATFEGCTKLKNITIPSKVTSILEHAFSGCRSLEYVVIPDSVINIGKEAFADCTSLKQFVCADDSYAAKWADKNGIKHSDHINKDPISIDEASIDTIPDQVYTGQSIKPTLTVTYKKDGLVEGKDYSVKWKNNKNPGKATITITGIDPNTGTKTATFKILPKPVELSSLKAGKKSLTAKWKKGSKIDGYEIQYSLKSNFKSAKKIEISGAGTKKAEINGLKKKKIYYVRIRTYKEVGGKKYYSEWSEAMKEKTK